ncbi:hypothetical protein ACRQ1B_16335 [Rhizobium panacihumi]|uniref:hypothetical protein n=1 Tax=Rhizobium panacihumi TaxID=2008450 RepID=UPI003D793AD5
MTATKDAFFKPEKISVRDKAKTTTEIARQITEMETANRISKTVRLRQLREAQPVALKAVRPARRQKTELAACS